MTINKNITSKNIDFLICELDLLSPLDPRVLQDPPLRDFSSHGFSLHGSPLTALLLGPMGEPRERKVDPERENL